MAPNIKQLFVEQTETPSTSWWGGNSSTLTCSSCFHHGAFLTLSLRKAIIFPTGFFLQRDWGEASVLRGGGPDVLDTRGSSEIHRVCRSTEPAGTWLLQTIDYTQPLNTSVFLYYSVFFHLFTLSKPPSAHLRQAWELVSPFFHWCLRVSAGSEMRLCSLFCLWVVIIGIVMPR